MIGTNTLRVSVGAQVLSRSLTSRARHAEESVHAEAGLTTLEIVIWGLGLFLAATAAIGVITAAINSRVNGIS